MNPLEDALRDALRRENPPADFAERVVACVRQPVPEGPAWFWQRLRLVFRAPMLRLATVGAACLLLVVGVQHQRRERAKAKEFMVIRPDRESTQGWTRRPKGTRATSHDPLNEHDPALNVFWLLQRRRRACAGALRKRGDGRPD